MEKEKKNRLEAKGYKIGSAEDFLGLSKEQSEYIDMKLALAETLAKQRKQKNLTQIQLAKLLQSSQSRIAKMERWKIWGIDLRRFRGQLTKLISPARYTSQ